MIYRLVSGVFFLLICGIVFLCFPKFVLVASKMGALEDEALFRWSVQMLGIVFVSIAAWFVYAAVPH